MLDIVNTFSVLQYINENYIFIVGWGGSNSMQIVSSFLLKMKEISWLYSEREEGSCRWR